MVAARFRTSRVIHGAIVASVVLYAIVAHVLLASGWQGSMGAGTPAALRWALYGLAAVACAAVLLLKPHLLSAEGMREAARRGGIEAALGALQGRLVILLAVAELPVLWGLILFLVAGGGLGEFYTFWAASLLLLLVLTPRRDVWDEVARTGGQPG